MSPATASPLSPSARSPSWPAARGALLTLSYLGAMRSIPGYNVMGLAKASLEANVRFLAADLGPQGVRVNGISAGPIKTLAAAGIPGFRKMLSRVAEVAPLRRNVTLEDVGNAAAFLCSDLAAGITGEILYVDAGFSTVGHELPARGRRLSAPGGAQGCVLFEGLGILAHVGGTAHFRDVGHHLVLTQILRLLHGRDPPAPSDRARWPCARAVTATTAAPPSLSASARKAGLPSGEGMANTASRTCAWTRGVTPADVMGRICAHLQLLQYRLERGPGLQLLARGLGGLQGRLGSLLLGQGRHDGLAHLGERLGLRGALLHHLGDDEPVIAEQQRDRRCAPPRAADRRTALPAAAVPDPRAPRRRLSGSSAMSPCAR